MPRSLENIRLVVCNNPTAEGLNQRFLRVFAKSDFRKGVAKLLLCRDDRQVVAHLSEITFGNRSKLASKYIARQLTIELHRIFITSFSLFPVSVVIDLDGTMVHASRAFHADGTMAGRV
jgi:hypothetical protein